MEQLREGKNGGVMHHIHVGPVLCQCHHCVRSVLLLSLRVQRSCRKGPVVAGGYTRTRCMSWRDNTDICICTVCPTVDSTCQWPFVSAGVNNAAPVSHDIRSINLIVGSVCEGCCCMFYLLQRRIISVTPFTGETAPNKKACLLQTAPYLANMFTGLIFGFGFFWMPAE